MAHSVEHLYLQYNGESFFTVVLLPDKDGKYPTVICRSPYVSGMVNADEGEIAKAYYDGMKRWLEQGYAVICQHCRGQGKSTGAFVPYIQEREDGLSLREWVRNQPFYNGEIFLTGGSYTSSLHYATAPFESDIKGAVFEVQDSERYRLWYRNGQMRKGHANWHFGLYKAKCGLPKQFNMASFSQLPLQGLSRRVLGDTARDFEEMLCAEAPDHPFWQTRFGGIDAKDAVSDVHFPVLLTTGYNDYYIGGVFKMWEQMTPATRAQSAVLVSPYNHGDGYSQGNGLAFPNGHRWEQFGKDYSLAWFEHIRKGTPAPCEKGVISYYRTFEDRWESDFYKTPTTPMSVPLGTATVSFTYDPAHPTAFRSEGIFAENFTAKNDVITLCTAPFEKDTFVKGQMRVKLTVASQAEDTSFYVRISIQKSACTYVLRHDITSLCYRLGDYKPNDVVELDFAFDEYAFLIGAGECLRVDIASTDNNAYVCHTNRKGPYYLQTGTTPTENTVYLDKSVLILPVE